MNAPAALPLARLPVRVVEGLDQPGAWRRRGGAWVFEHRDRARTPFSQIAPSVQVRLPRGAVLRIQIAVERAGGGRGPFLDVGWQGAFASLRRRRLRADGAHVDIDYLKIETPARGWRLRLVLRGLARSERPWALRWGLVGVTWRGRGRHRRSAAMPALGAVPPLKVPRASQRAEGGRDGALACSPTSTQMLMAHQGVRVPVRRVMRAAWDPVAGIYGNWQRAISAAWAFGCPGLLVYFRHWGQVRDCLRAGLPVAASIKFPRGQVTLPGAPIGHSAGHLVVIRGLAPGGWVLVNDPAARTRRGVSRRYPLRAFSRAWFGFSGMGYLIFPPAR